MTFRSEGDAVNLSHFEFVVPSSPGLSRSCSIESVESENDHLPWRPTLSPVNRAIWSVGTRD